MHISFPILGTLKALLPEFDCVGAVVAAMLEVESSQYGGMKM